MDAEALARVIDKVRFTPVRMREGYEMREVDQFLDRLSAAIRAGEPVDQLIGSARFGSVRMREGYDMGDVDTFLQRVATGDPTLVPPDGVIEEQRGFFSRIFGRG